MAQVKVKVPFGTKVVVMAGMRWEADPYGFIYCSEADAERICKDRQFKRGGVREGIVDVSQADPIGTQISQSVAAKSEAAASKIAGMAEKK